MDDNLINGSGSVSIEESVNNKIESITNRYLTNSQVYKGFGPVAKAIKDTLLTVQELVIALKSGNLFIITAAAKALGEKRNKDAIEPLILHVVNRKINLIGWEFALITAIRALGIIGDSSAIRHLNCLLNHEKKDVQNEARTAINNIELLNHEDENVRAKAQVAINRLIQVSNKKIYRDDKNLHKNIGAELENLSKRLFQGIHKKWWQFWK